jgi:hypothetical protein
MMTPFTFKDPIGGGIVVLSINRPVVFSLDMKEVLGNRGKDIPYSLENRPNSDILKI